MHRAQHHHVRAISAAERGNLAMLWWPDANQGLQSPGTCVVATARGHLAMLQWLHCNRAASLNSCSLMIVQAMFSWTATTQLKGLNCHP